MNRIQILGSRVGSDEPGNLARTIISVASANKDMQVVNVSEPTEADMYIYCRRQGDQLRSVVDLCRALSRPLLFLSTGIEFERYITKDFPFIVAPNTSFETLRFLSECTNIASTHNKTGIRIVEHHQESKHDVSGTALRLAADIDIEPSAITSVRDWALSSREFAIPEECRAGYAVHQLYDGGTLLHELVTTGRDLYAKGALTIVAAQLHERVFPNGRSDVTHEAIAKLF